MFPGHLTIGAFVSLTETVKLLEPVRPDESVAEQMTVVDPTGKLCGELITVPPILQVGTIAPSHASVALVVKLTEAEHIPGSLFADMLLGTETEGTELISKAPISTCVQYLRGKPAPR